MARASSQIPLAVTTSLCTWGLVAGPLVAYAAIAAAWPAAAADGLSLALCCALVPTLIFGAWVIVAVPSQAVVAQREVYARVLDPDGDDMARGPEAEALRARALAQVTSRAQAVLPTGYRESVAPAGSWAAVALDPRCTDVPLTEAALTLAYLDRALARRGRGPLRALHRALWTKLRRLDPAQRPG